MEKKVVLITGASSGFGLSLAKKLLKLNYIVIASFRNAKDRLQIYDEELKQYPNSLMCLPLDVSKPNEIKSCVDYIENKFGKLDVLVNNAGFGLFGALEDLSEDQIRYQMEVNFFGALTLTKKLIPQMLRGSKIINISSCFGLFSFPLTSLYNSSKFALEGLSEALHYELRPQGISVHLVEPGGHRTEFGTSTVWGNNSSNPDSKYNESSLNYMELFNKKVSNKNGPKPDKVVNIILKIIKKRNSWKMRYLVGMDSKCGYLAKRFLPEVINRNINYLVFNLIFFKKKVARVQSEINNHV